MESLYFSDFVPLTEQPAVVHGINLLEELHTAPHGTVIGFERKAGRWEPSLSHSPIEAEQYTRVSYFQDATIAAVRELFLHGRDGPLRVDDLTPASALGAMAAVCLSPSARELAALGRLQHSTNFDHAHFTPMVPDGPPPARHDDMRRALEEARWPLCTLRSWHDCSAGLDRERVRKVAKEVLAYLDERSLRQFG